MQRFLLLAAFMVAAGFALPHLLAEDEAKTPKETNKLLFSLKDTEGKTHDLAKLMDKIVVLQWMEPECPWCVKCTKEGKVSKLVEKYGKKDVVFLGISSSSVSDAKALEAYRKESSLSYPILVDANGEVGRTYDAKTTPHMFVLQKGHIVYQGAIDDLKSGNKGINYVEQALEEILAGKKVSTPKTEPYGCPVKFKKKEEKENVG